MSPVPGTSWPRAARSRRTSREVVKLAVEDGDDVLGLVRRGLVAGLQIDHPQPAVPEDAAAEERDAARVGPAVEEGLGHAPDDVRVGRSGGRY